MIETGVLTIDEWTEEMRGVMMTGETTDATMTEERTDTTMKGEMRRDVREDVQTKEGTMIDQARETDVMVQLSVLEARMIARIAEPSVTTILRIEYKIEVKREDGGEESGTGIARVIRI